MFVWDLNIACLEGNMKHCGKVLIPEIRKFKHLIYTGGEINNVQ
jgi:hypothetical protein